MIYLLIVSLLWAPSFGMVPHFLKGIDSNFVAAARIVMSLLVFAPFARADTMKRSDILRLAMLGGMQFGLMYVLYIRSFSFGLNGAEVALFTIFTPLFVTLFDDLLERRMSWLFLLTASLAVLGTGIIQWTQLNRSGLVAGFVIMQCSNACFAAGQVLYRRIAPAIGKPDWQLMGIMYLGAAIVAGGAAAMTVSPAQVAALTATQLLVLAYLGAIASGMGFFLFNAGARRVDVGALAIFNNVKVPLAILTTVLLFPADVKSVDWARLVAGGAVIAAALALNESAVRRRATSGSAA